MMKWMKIIFKMTHEDRKYEYTSITTLNLKFEFNVYAPKRQ